MSYTNEQLKGIMEGNTALARGGVSVKSLAATILAEREETARVERNAASWFAEAERLRTALDRFVAAYDRITRAQGWLEPDRIGGVSPSEWIGPELSGAQIAAKAALGQQIAGATVDVRIDVLTAHLNRLRNVRDELRIAIEKASEQAVRDFRLKNLRDDIDKAIAGVSAQIDGLPQHARHGS